MRYSLRQLLIFVALAPCCFVTVYLHREFSATLANLRERGVIVMVQDYDRDPVEADKTATVPFFNYLQGKYRVTVVSLRPLGVTCTREDLQLCSRLPRCDMFAVSEWQLATFGKELERCSFDELLVLMRQESDNRLAASHSDKRASGDDVPEFQVSEIPANVRSLTLETASARPPGSSLLHAVASHSQLKSLNLTGYGVGEQAIEIISQSKSLTSLRFHHARVFDEKMQPVLRMKKLRHLGFIGGTYIDASFLRDAPDDCALESLELLDGMEVEFETKKHPLSGQEEGATTWCGSRGNLGIDTGALSKPRHLTTLVLTQSKFGMLINGARTIDGNYTQREPGDLEGTRRLGDIRNLVLVRPLTYRNWNKNKKDVRKILADVMTELVSNGKLEQLTIFTLGDPPPFDPNLDLFPCDKLKQNFAGNFTTYFRRHLYLRELGN